MNLPIEINPNPIIDATVEIRFSTSTHPSAVFGILFNVLKDKYPKVIELPILQIPEQLRNQDPNFIYKPLYKITDEKYSILIRPKVITFGSPSEYESWSKFSSQIYTCLNIISDLNIIDKVNRFGIRYIIFFDCDIFNKTQVKLLVTTQVNFSVNF